MNKRSLHTVLLLSALAAPAVAGAAEQFHEPQGFGKARFGMSVEAVRKFYPQLQPTQGRLQAAEKSGQLLMIYEMNSQSVGPLKPCAAQFRFFKNELYEVQFHCPDRVKVGEYLQKTYGTPTKADERAVFWMGKQSAVALAPRTGAFGFSDRKRTQAMQAMLFAQLNKAQPAAGTPGEAPARPAATPPAVPSRGSMRPCAP